MSRPIKFRAWQREEDEYYSRMVTSEQSVLTAIRHVYNGTGIATGSGFSDINNQPNPDRYTLMQYTGLKDKNGAEIYEGDIVDFSGEYEVKFGIHGVPDIEEQAYTDHANGFYLKAQHDLKCVAPFNMDIPLNKIYAKQCIIIGNIFEHPHLLEGADS